MWGFFLQNISAEGWPPEYTVHVLRDGVVIELDQFDSIDEAWSYGFDAVIAGMAKEG